MYEEPGILYEIMWVAVPASVLGVLIGLGVFAGVYFAIGSSLKHWANTYKPPVPQEASEIIRERYARGEISRREYEQIKQDLEY